MYRINVSEVIDFQFSKNKASRPAKGLTSSVSGTPDDPELFCRAKTDDDGCMASESFAMVRLISNSSDDKPDLWSLKWVVRHLEKGSSA
ncbi:hypothetical protein ABEB36_009254 [Hypothenemus hampei]|uniref:Uncharacterized protein n=1 Tax=Hypothenemus hampei TaxID=57062 RepID=A0ABD1EFT3_HYPHA